MFSNSLLLIMDLLLLLLLLFRITSTSSQRQHRWQLFKKFVQTTSMNFGIGESTHTRRPCLLQQTIMTTCMPICLLLRKKILHLFDPDIKRYNSLDTCPIHANTKWARNVSFLYSMLVFADIYISWFFFVQVCKLIEIVSVDFPLNDLFWSMLIILSSRTRSKKKSN